MIFRKWQNESHFSHAWRMTVQATWWSLFPGHEWIGVGGGGRAGKNFGHKLFVIILVGFSGWDLLD